jgi:general secretion pathway protein A
MYLKHFHLREEPFATTPDPRFLYKSPVHQEALDRIMTSVASRRGINAIIGEPGLGKSMLIRTLLKGFNSMVQFAWIFNTTMNSRELVRYISRDFGFKPKGDDLGDLLIELYTFLIREYEQGRFSVLIIDEAQNLKPEVLEEIRQLSNLETASQKLLQVILSGQPQLDLYLQDPALVQLKQRISLKATLHRLNESDTVAYIQHRLKVAGARKQEIFTAAALQMVFEISDGIPRLINQVCDNALLSAAAQKTKQIDAALIIDLVNENKVMAAPPLMPLKRDPVAAVHDDPPVPEQEPLPVVLADTPVQAAAAVIPAEPKPERPVKRPRMEPAVELEFASGFDGLDLGELAIF